MNARAALTIVRALLFAWGLLFVGAAGANLVVPEAMRNVGAAPPEAERFATVMMQLGYGGFLLLPVGWLAGRPLWFASAALATMAAMVVPVLRAADASPGDVGLWALVMGSPVAAQATLVACRLAQAARVQP